MKNTKTAWLIIISIIISLNLFGQNTSGKKILTLADSLYNNHLYKTAVKEYQRYLFFSGEESVDVLLKVAGGLFQMDNFNLAFQYYEQIYFLSDNPEIKFGSLIPEINYRLSQKEYKKALISLFNASASYYDRYPEIIDFLLGICYFGMEDFQKAQTHFAKICSDNPTISKELSDIFADKKRFYKPNPNTLSILSLFIPGTGQFLSGNFKEGLNSFLLVEGIGVVAILVAIHYSLADALLSVMPWYQRYLIGGSENTEEIAVRKREKNRNEIYQEILLTLQPYRGKLELPLY